MKQSLSWKSSVKLVKRYLYFGDSDPYELKIFPEYSWASFEIRHQVEILMHRYFTTMCNYREKLKSENGDILCSCEDLNSTNPFVLHLHMSTDGGQLYRYRRQTLWPIHSLLLDLPNHIRWRPENIITFGLWLSAEKPKWSHFLSNILVDSIIGKQFSLIINGSVVNVLVKIHSAVFDLPALASVINHVQYNGKFGCVFCCSPGIIINVGKGYSRKYGEVIDLLSDETYSSYCEIANNTQETVFGIKGRSCLHGYLKIPSSILIDSLHLLFENCSKSLFQRYMDSSFFRERYYLGRHISSYVSVCDNIKIPSFLTKPRSLKDLSYWKGRDIMNFLFYYSVPTIFRSLYYKQLGDNEHAFHFVTFLTACKMCYLTSARSLHTQINELFNYFHSRLVDLYDVNICTINMHLLLHLSRQVERFGSLPYCSMFTFEHQFFSYNVLTQGTTSFLNQICDKLTLLKYCKLFLEVSNYCGKDNILKCLSIDTDTENFVYVNRGHIKCGRLNFYAECYNRLGKNSSTVVEVCHDGEIFFASICYFQRKASNEICAQVNLLSSCNIPMLRFDSFNLPSVPRHIINLVNDNCMLHAMRISNVQKIISVTDIIHPCVVVDKFDTNLDPSNMVVMPCAVVPEYC